jgi:pantoate--beta-alanine ligase
MTVSFGSPLVFERLSAWREYRASAALKNKSLGFVPTMGALHEGHHSLVERSRKENDVTAVSVFVNPTQFNDPKDLEKYPREPEKDLEKLKSWGADFVLFPNYSELYIDDYRFKVQEYEASRVLCGEHRPGHFDGVLTVVMKLFNVVGAERAYFGEKDYQQYRLVHDMARAFFMNVDIIGCPTVRESDGLAMSSRNARLSPEARMKAALFAKTLASGRTPAEITADLRKLGFEVDYVEERWGRKLAAVVIDGVRLIDNVEA